MCQILYLYKPINLCFNKLLTHLVGLAFLAAYQKTSIIDNKNGLSTLTI